jgi:antitoxin component YwqK of YwqJK toxin-antitoxin module
VSGLLHGTSEYFYRNARLKARVNYEKGVPEGLWEYFDMDGVKLKSIRYQKGVELQQQ